MPCEITAHTIIMCLECITFCWWCIFVQDGGSMAKPVGVHKGIGNILSLMLMLTGSYENNTTALKTKTLCSFALSKQCTIQADIQH